MTFTGLATDNAYVLKMDAEDVFGEKDPSVPYFSQGMVPGGRRPSIRLGDGGCHASAPPNYIRRSVWAFNTNTADDPRADHVQCHLGFGGIR